MRLLSKMNKKKVVAGKKKAAKRKAPNDLFGGFKNYCFLFFFLLFP